MTVSARMVSVYPRPVSPLASQQTRTCAPRPQPVSAIALVVQLAITIADVSITGSGVIVSSAALLVPFALAVIGERARDRDHGRGGVRHRHRQPVLERHAEHRPDDLPDRLLRAGRAAHGGRRAGARARHRSGRQQRGARARPRCHAGAARRHPRLARRGRDRARRARQDRLRERGRRAAARAATASRRCSAGEPGELAARFTITQGGRHRRSAVDDLPGPPARRRARTRRRCSPAASDATPARRSGC